jgi:hypothetical protein
VKLRNPFDSSCARAAARIFARVRLDDSRRFPNE